MNTQFVNFDFKSLLSTSDSEHASVFGRQHSKSSNGNDGQQFSDEFMKASNPLGVEAGVSDEVEVGDAAAPEKIAGDTAVDVVSFSSNRIELPVVGLSEKGEMPSKNIEYRLPVDIEASDGSVEFPVQSIRKLADNDSYDWEKEFLAAGPIGDNFTAVESAISRRVAPVEGVEQSAVGTGLKTKQKDVSEPSVHRSQDAQIAIDVNLADNHHTEIVAATNAIAQATYSYQQNLVLDQSEPNLQAEVTFAQSSAIQGTAEVLNDNKRSANREQAPGITNAGVPIDQHKESSKLLVSVQRPENIEKTEPLSGRVRDADRSLISEVEQVSFSAGAKTSSNGSTVRYVKGPVVEMQPENDLTDAQLSKAPQAVEKPLFDETGRSQKPLVRQHDELNKTVQSSADKQRQDFGAEKASLLASEKQTTTVMPDRFFANQERPVSNIELPLNRPVQPLIDSQKTDYSSKSVVTTDIAQSVPIENPTKTNTSSALDQLINPSSRSIAQSTLGYQNKKTSQGKVENLSKGRPIEIDFRQTAVDTAMEGPAVASSSPSGDRNAVQQSKIINSLNLRIGDKVEADQPSTKTIQPQSTDNINVDNEQATMNVETQQGFGEKLNPVSQNAQSLNPAMSTVTQKPLSFDWNSPKFAERFAAEIGDLNIDGDIKKFEINPRNLGRLEVAFVARGSSEIIRIEAESQAARDVIAQHSQAIQEMLKAQGRPDVSIRVDLRDGNFSSHSETNQHSLAQQDGTETREDRSDAQSGSDRILTTNIPTEPESARDEGRYA